MHLHTAQAHFVPAFSTWLDVANMRLIKRIEKSFEVDQCLASQVLETRPDLLTVGRFRGRSWGAPVLETLPQFSPM